MRGLAKNCNAVKKWSPEYFVENYGDTELLTLGKNADTKVTKNNAYTSFTQTAE